MKKLLIITLLSVSSSIVLYCQSSDNIIAQKWIQEKFAKGKIPPFSFVYDGKPSDSFISTWGYKSEKLKSSEEAADIFLYTYSDKKSGLVVKCLVTCYNDFNTAEYVLTFANTSSINTPVIEKASVIDEVFSYNTEGSFKLHHSLGGNAAVNDFQPFDEEMQIGKSIYLTPGGGRSSGETALPFFNIESPVKQGIVVAIGWTGKWYSEVVQNDKKSVWLKSGMENMHLILYPAEEIRTPKICLLFWNGENRMAGHNQFRRFVLAHHTRKIKGQIPIQPLSSAFELDAAPSPCDVHICATEASALAHIKRYQQFKFSPDLFWLDAGWYTGCTWKNPDGQWGLNVGNWTIDKERFPNGLKPISDAAHAAGAKFMVWFEFERVREGTEIYNEHPDWLLRIPNSENYLFDLGNNEARIWLTNYLSDFIKKEGIDYYRQDFNMDPLPYWKNIDAPNRIGISEAKHISGLYAFWDSLLARFPDIIIDNCAAGGRRIDLETISRSTPFWRTDLEQNATGNQCHTYGLNLYVPLHGTGFYRPGKYYVRSSYGSTAVINWSINRGYNESIISYQQYMEDFKRIREYYLGDYYPLTPLHKRYMEENRWLAYQLNRPDQQDGIVLAFRREKNQEETIQVQLNGLNKDWLYELFYEDSGIKVIRSGKELLSGIEIKIPEKPGSLLISYRVINKQQVTN